MFSPDPRCKICSLPEDLIKAAHYARFVEGVPLQELCKMLDRMCKERGLKVTKFYPTSVSTHFKKHVDPQLVATYMTQASPAVRRVTSVDKGKIKNIDDHLASIVSPENLELFERLQDIIDHITYHIEVLEEALPTKETIHNPQYDEEVLNTAYAPYVKLIKELRGTIEASAKFLNLKNVLRRFVEDLLREYTHHVTEAFLEEMRYMQKELFSDDPLSSSLMKEVSVDFANKLATVTDNVVDKFERILASERI